MGRRVGGSSLDPISTKMTKQNSAYAKSVVQMKLEYMLGTGLKTRESVDLVQLVQSVAIIQENALIQELCRH